MATDARAIFFSADVYAIRVCELDDVASISSVTLSSNSLIFSPSQVLGASPPSQILTLTNSGNYPLKISNIAISGSSDFAKTDTCGPLPASISPGGSCILTATFQASGPGRAATPAITDSVMSSPQSIAVPGAGIDFSIAAAPARSTSAAVSPGQTASYALQVSATGGFSPNNQLSVATTCTGAPPDAACCGPVNAIGVTPSLPGAFTVKVSTTANSSLPPFIAPALAPRQELLMLEISALLLILLFLTTSARQNSPITRGGAGRRR